MTHHFERSTSDWIFFNFIFNSKEEQESIKVKRQSWNSVNESILFISFVVLDTFGKKKIEDGTYSVIENDCLSFFFFLLMSRDYKSVCEELDALTVSYLSILEEYREQWKESSRELEEVRKEEEEEVIKK